MIDLPEIPVPPDDGRTRRLVLHVGTARTISYMGRIRDLEAHRRTVAGHLTKHPTPVPDGTTLEWEWR